jgi:hypothetical protein
MENENPALERLVAGNIIGYLAAEYSNNNTVPLADALKHVLGSGLFPRLMDSDLALIDESLPLLYEEIV